MRVQNHAVLLGAHAPDPCLTHRRRTAVWIKQSKAAGLLVGVGAEEEEEEEEEEGNIDMQKAQQK